MHTLPSALRGTVVSACGLLLVFASTSIGQLRVSFDAPRQATCKPVTKGKRSRLQVTIPVSSLLEKGSEKQLGEFVYRMEFLSQRVIVKQISPPTTLASMVKGNIGVEEKSERKQSAGVNFSGKLQQWLRFSAVADTGSKKNTNLRFQRKATQQAVIVSGNIHRSRGAYVKFRPAVDRSLEGKQRLSIVVEVPADWKRDLLDLHCLAISKGSGKHRVCGQRRFLIAIARQPNEGDDIESFILSERKLRAEAHRFQLARNRRTLDNALRNVFCNSSVPNDWLQRVVFEAAQPPKKLPAKLRKSAARYLAARRRLLGM
jgi:hypothetical protein